MIRRTLGGNLWFSRIRWNYGPLQVFTNVNLDLDQK